MGLMELLFVVNWTIREINHRVETNYSVLDNAK